jgi:hypothetical protein
MLASNFVIITSPKLVGADVFRLYISVAATTAIIPSGQVVITNNQGATVVITSSLSTVWLALTVRQSQFISVALFLDSVDVSLFLVNSLEVHWPDDGNGQCTFSLVTQNPFGSPSPFNIESVVDVFAVYTDPDNGTKNAVRMFKGKISHFDYEPEKDTANITAQDMSRTVSRPTDKLNADILGVDPIVTEKVTVASPNILSVTQTMDLDSPNAIIGIWAESDTAFKINLTALMNYTYLSATTIQSFNGGILNVGSNYQVRYQVPLSSFVVPNFTKSQVLTIIAGMAGIPSLFNERTGQFEDEVVAVNITANDELPLDLMRKIVVPQTWKVEFDEFGTLHIRREYLKAVEDFTLDVDRVIEDTLAIAKDTDGVINEITVVGIIKRTGGGNFSTPTF